MIRSRAREATDRFAAVKHATDQHRANHGCWAYPFDDGPLLGMLAGAIRPRRILELGTALGYTALWMAYGAPQATIETIEADDEHVRLARANLAAYEVHDRIQVHHGRFGAVLAGLAPGFELAFFDGYAPELSDLQSVIRLLRSDGVLICANLNLDPLATSDFHAVVGDPDLWQTSFALMGSGVAISVQKPSRS